jgi:hypothetical protein
VTDYLQVVGVVDAVTQASLELRQRKTAAVIGVYEVEGEFDVEGSQNLTQVRSSHHEL